MSCPFNRGQETRFVQDEKEQTEDKENQRKPRSLARSSNRHRRTCELLHSLSTQNLPKKAGRRSSALTRTSRRVSSSSRTFPAPRATHVIES